jgi:hypothetical protein
LPPGKHTLQLVLGDAKHYPFNPPIISKKITVTEMNVATVRPATTVVRNGSRAGCLGSPRLLKSASIAIRVARVEAIGLARNPPNTGFANDRRWKASPGASSLRSAATERVTVVTRILEAEILR